MTNTPEFQNHNSGNTTKAETPAQREKRKQESLLKKLEEGYVLNPGGTEPDGDHRGSIVIVNKNKMAHNRRPSNRN